MCRRQTRGIYGYLRTRAWLEKKHGVRVNHKHVYRLMKELGISSVIRRMKRNYVLKEVFVISNNKLNREFQATRPLEKWVTDITYLPFGHSFLYLSTCHSQAKDTGNTSPQRSWVPVHLKSI
ncbi:IS3 family transposase [Brevibacillus choshinensis]|uniref:IS3 family transposase n=1 Tax=Brevibacillus choshinensis TaxID=54911 RepID=UPI00399C86E8